MPLKTVPNEPVPSFSSNWYCSDRGTSEAALLELGARAELSATGETGESSWDETLLLDRTRGSPPAALLRRGLSSGEREGSAMLG